MSKFLLAAAQPIEASRRRPIHTSDHGCGAIGRYVGPQINLKVNRWYDRFGGTPLERPPLPTA